MSFVHFTRHGEILTAYHTERSATIASCLQAWISKYRPIFYCKTLFEPTVKEVDAKEDVLCKWEKNNE